MSKLTIVTLETDGLRDFVRLPSGVRYILGAMSVLKLVTTLVSDMRTQRQALERFNRHGEAIVALDVDRMLELLAPRPIRRANHGFSFIPVLKQTPSTSMEGNIMSHAKHLLDQKLSHIENTIRAMSARVANDETVPSKWAHSLRAAAVDLPDFGDQSKNDAFSDLGAPKVDTMEDPGAWTPPTNITHPLGKSAAVLAANSDIVEAILTKVAETSDKVAALETAGRPFNASRAQADLHKIAAEVHTILSNVDMAEGWVGAELTALAKRAGHIHRLFASARS